MTSERGAMPRVAQRRRGLSGTAIAIGAILAAMLLFSTLDARRRALSAPAVRPAMSDLAAVSDAPPQLYVPPPPRLAVEAREQASELPPTTAPIPSRPPQPPPAPSPSPYAEPPPISYAPPPPPPAPPRTTSGAILVVDAGQPSLSAERPAPATGGEQSSTDGHIAPRSRAGAISGPSSTVPQGTLIPAVLETAFNSTGSGFARALVQRDVHSFDGHRVLIPRGSRLIGEYRSETSPGQKRAFVTWTRLVRPDGVTIALASPTTDPVGVGGVRAKVDSHFFERFAGAILQSALSIGTNLATRSIGDQVIVALPGAMPGTGTAMPATQIPPTLSVRQGTSISVFVARDLDFSGVETRR